MMRSVPGQAIGVAAPTRRRRWTVVLGLVALAMTGCDSSPSSPTSVASVRFTYLASTTPRTDLPPSTESCVLGVGRTHIHPSWRGFARVDMTAAASRWEITFADVPVNQRLSIRISDGNVCDENPTGAATRNVFADDVRLVEIVPTPGSGVEPGLAFTVDGNGRVTP